MYGSSLEDGDGILQRDYEKPEDHCDDLHNREFDNNGDEYSNLGRRPTHKTCEYKLVQIISTLTADHRESARCHQ